MTLSRRSYTIGHRKQSGIVLVITLIVLVAMTLAAISLIRSVDTTNVIAGNLAFHSSATDAADMGIAQAATLLTGVFTAKGLYCDQTLPPPAGCMSGYRSRVEPHLEPPYPNTTWDSFWANVSVNAKNAVNPPNGFTVGYVVERICDNTDPDATCSKAVPIPDVTCGSGGGSRDAPATICLPISLTYYRVTVRSAGPRNTVSYVQTILAM